MIINGDLDMITEKEMEDYLIKSGWQKSKESWHISLPKKSAYRTLRQAYKMQIRLDGKENK